MLSILIVDDDTEIQEELSSYLQANGIQTSRASNVESARDLMRRSDFDMILLDLWLGSESGFDFLRDVRKTRTTPCIMVTAQDDATDKVVGLELGADDYVVKPVNLRELLARIRALLRRRGGDGNMNGADSPQGTNGQGNGGTHGKTAWNFDPQRRNLLSPSGVPVPLTTAECDLLIELVANEGKPQSRDNLCRRVFSRQWQPYDRSLDGLIVKLRRKLEPNPENPLVIKTVRGKGYVFTGFLN